MPSLCRHTCTTHVHLTCTLSSSHFPTPTHICVHIYLWVIRALEVACVFIKKAHLHTYPSALKVQAKAKAQMRLDAIAAGLLWSIVVAATEVSNTDEDVHTAVPIVDAAQARTDMQQGQVLASAAYTDLEYTLTNKLFDIPGGSAGMRAMPSLVVKQTDTTAAPESALERYLRPQWQRSHDLSAVATVSAAACVVCECDCFFF